MTIGTLRNLHVTGSFEQIMDDSIIEGIITADDSRDNFYKALVIQDTTAGITVKMEGYSLYNQYPAGTRILIRLKGLWLGDYGRNIQLGAGVDRSVASNPSLSGIPQALFGRYIVKAGNSGTVQPKTITIDELNDSYQSQLIRLEQIEFAASDTGKPYADIVNKQSVNHTLKVCGGGSIYVRTSAYARFAGINTPRGNGSITAVYSVYKTEKQLLIRDTSDIQMNDLRCTGTGPKTLLNEDFETGIADTELILQGWKNIAEAGDRKFMSKKAGDNGYTELSAFATGQPSVITWLITPAINLNNSANEILSCKTKDGYDNGAILQVLISTNYDGGSTPWKAKWTQLAAMISKGSTNIAANWVNSGNINLNSYAGNVYIAFRYEGGDPVSTIGKHTTTFRLDDVKIIGN
ncbi:DUF5689 domain-containing protein [Sediminibacterium ginsengisoli]|nr:DUF5689 domain-containing protein [Sediminibacterium ginsengisoli]